MSFQTLLAIAELGIAPYSARGLTERLELVAAATAQRRTVNGTLTDLSLPGFRKYRLTLSATDGYPPALDGVWPGQVLTVDVTQELSHPDGTPGVHDRTAVPGSERSEGGFTFYRPRLTMMVAGRGQDLDEWEAALGWSLVLEEV